MSPVVSGPLGPGHQLFPGSEGDEPGTGTDLEQAWLGTRLWGLDVDICPLWGLSCPVCQSPSCTPHLHFLRLTNQCSACSTCSMTYHVLWAQSQHVPGPGVGESRAWLGGVVPEEGQKNERSERFKEEARDEQNMRLGPHQERLGMETEAERLSQSASPESRPGCVCVRGS